MQHERCKLAHEMIGGTPNLYMRVVRHSNVSTDHATASSMDDREWKYVSGDHIIA